MKKRYISVVIVLVAVLLTSTVQAPAGESCGCGSSFDKRAALDVCRVVRQVFGHTAFRTCVQFVKSCEKA